MTISLLKLMAKTSLARVLFRYYPITLSPLRLSFWVSEVIKSQSIEGDCVEIGVNLGGTSIFTKKALDELEIRKKYWCYDTFSGFVRKQLESDLKRGLRSDTVTHFSANSEKLVKKIFQIHNVDNIVTVKGDIESQTVFPGKVSCCLIDVDLSEPTYAALRKIYPILSPGGTILIDDCNDAESMDRGSWRASEGVARFAKEHAISVEYKYGMGIIRKQ